jgi:hypothetical protein
VEQCEVASQKSPGSQKSMVVHAAPAETGPWHLPAAQVSVRMQSKGDAHAAPSVPKGAQCIVILQVRPEAQVPFRQAAPEAPRVTHVGGAMLWSQNDPIVHSPALPGPQGWPSAITAAHVPQAALDEAPPSTTVDEGTTHDPLRHCSLRSASQAAPPGRLPLFGNRHALSLRSHDASSTWTHASSIAGVVGWPGAASWLRHA